MRNLLKSEIIQVLCRSKNKSELGIVWNIFKIKRKPLRYKKSFGIYRFIYEN